MTHTTFQEEIATYLAGGLSAEESAEFETHAGSCQACAAILAKEKQMDATMRNLFGGVFPGEAFGTRLVKGVRDLPRRVHPFVKAALSAAAAAVILGAVGYFGGNRLESKPGVARAETHGNLKQIGTGLKLAFADGHFDYTAPAAGTEDAGIVANTDGSTSHFALGDTPAAFGNYFAGTTVVNGTFSGNTTAVPALQAGVSGGLAQSAKGHTQPAKPELEFSKGLDEAKDKEVVREKAVAGDQLVATQWSDATADRTKGNDLAYDYQKAGEAAKQKSLDDKSGARGEDVKKTEVAALAKAPVSSPDAGREPGRDHRVDFALSENLSAPPLTQATTQPGSDRKIIRTGTMEFEVDSFDSAAERLGKIVSEEKGFVASTDSEKLPNGKVKGVITLRCPPEHLDALVMKLRGLGDLKTQRITASDVTKQFTDFESQLRAARAMEERLLDIIKTGKGTVKDLVEAEKQLGVYREKIEQVEGELRFMNSQVSLSTLSVSLTERDIRSPFAAVQSETVNGGIEAEDVEKARGEAIKLIEEAKGRVIESGLKKMEAGQLAATIVAEVSPDAAGALGDKLKMLGQVSRWEAERKQTAEGGNRAPAQLAANARLEKQATHFNLSIYNLANVAPRQRTGLTLVTNDVEAAYRSLLAAVNGDGKNPPIGRVLASNLNSEKSDQISGSITLEVKSDQAAAVEAALHSAGSVMHLTVSDNADQNTTTAKRWYGVAIISATTVPAREQQTVSVASKDVEATYNKLIEVLRDAKTSAHLTASQLAQQDPENVVGSLDFEIPISARAAVEAVLSDGKQSDVTSRNVSRAADTENTLADKVRLTVTISAADRLPPRETVKLTLETGDVQKAVETAAGVGGSDGHLLERKLAQQPDGASSGHVVIDVPLGMEGATVDELRSLGKVRGSESSKNPSVTSGPLARARFDVTFGNAQTLVAPEEGMGSSIRAGLRKALAGLLWSVEMVVIGVVLVGPFALVAWIGWKVFRRRKVEQVS